MKNFNVFDAVVEKLSEAVGSAYNRSEVFAGFWERLPVHMQMSKKVNNCLATWENHPHSDYKPVRIQNRLPHWKRRNPYPIYAPTA